MIFKKELAGHPMQAFPKVSKDDKKRCRYTASAEIVNLPRSGRILIVEFFEIKGETFKARFVTDGKNYQTACEWPIQKWTQKNPRHVLCECGVAFTDAAAKEINGFLRPEDRECYSYYYSGAMRAIDSFVSEIGYQARLKEYKRREEIRKQHFSMYPEYPQNLEEYCDKNVFDHGYIFISKLNKKGEHKAWCSECGKHFTVDRSARSGQQAACPKCEKPAIYRGDWITSTIQNKAKLCIAHKVDSQLILRWLNVERTFAYPKFKKRYEFDDYAYNLYLHTPQGDKLYFYKWMRCLYWYGYDWYRGKVGDYCWDSTYIYTDNLDEVFGDRYYNVNIKAGLEGKHAEIIFVKLLNNLKNHPAAEYLFKINLPLFAANADALIPECIDTKPSFTNVLGVSKQLQTLYISNNVTVTEHSVIRAYGKWVSEEDLKAYRTLNIEFKDVDLAIALVKRMSFSKFVNYFTKQKKLYKKPIGYLLRMYRDYIDMSAGLGVDMSHKSVRFPKNCIDAHNQILPRFNQLKHEAEDMLFVNAVKPLYEDLNITEYEKNGFCIVLPQLRSDLITEGQSLNHCVGGEGYYKRHIEGINMIFFVRKTEARTKPYFTMEIDMTTFKIKQLYGFGDCSAPKDVRKFAEGFVKELAKPESEMRKAS